MTKFYTYGQNNSGGHFHEDENVAEYVIIEANDYKQANERAENIGIYFDGCYTGNDCNCCGDRWYEADESDGHEEPTIYGKPVAEVTSTLFRKECRIHYMNGKVETVIFKD